MTYEKILCLYKIEITLSMRKIKNYKHKDIMVWFNWQPFYFLSVVILMAS